MQGKSPKAVILAGGKGTRLAEETDLRPKPMVEIGGKPILWHIMKIYAAYGVTEFIVCLGYKGYLIKEYFLNYYLHTDDVIVDLQSRSVEVRRSHGEPWKVHLIETGEDTMTGGRLKRVLPHLEGDDEFFMTYGDGVANIDIRALLDFHRREGKWATITAVHSLARFGSLTLDENGVAAFREKPQEEAAWINGGFFVLSPKVFDLIPGDECVWEQDPLSRLAADGQLAAYRHAGFWQPMDTLREKQMLQSLWQSPEGASVEGVEMNANFWSGKRVFVTGHTGFKGAWLVQMLDYLGARVTGYALPPDTTPSLYRLARLDETLDSVMADVVDVAALATAVKSAQPQIIFHLAAQGLVRRSYVKPLETYATNVMGTAHLLEAVRACPEVRAVVTVTSDKCYKNQEWCWGYRENDPLGGHDPYSSSKGCAELVSDSYRRSFFRNGPQAHQAALATARAGNVIGGGDWAEDRLLPDCIRSLARGEAISVRSPAATRPWQHVLEPLRGYLMLAEALWLRPDDTAGGWNFGPYDRDARAVKEVVSRTVEIWGNGARWQIAPDASMHEAMSLQLDCSKAHRLLHWEPLTDLETALGWTVDWYRRQQAGEDSRALCRQQIEAFQALSAARIPS